MPEAQGHGLGWVAVSCRVLPSTHVLETDAGYDQTCPVSTRPHIGQAGFSAEATFGPHLTGRGLSCALQNIIQHPRFPPTRCH